jgi:hypothetical protein
LLKYDRKRVEGIVNTYTTILKQKKECWEFNSVPAWDAPSALTLRNRDDTMKHLLLFILLPLFLSQAQDDDPLKFFPHKTGDMWEYHFFEWGEPTSWYDTLQIFTIFDSTDSKGIIHIKQYSRSINPIKYPDTLRYWIDTINYYVYGSGIHGDNTLIYKLNAQKGEKWFDTTRHEATEVIDKWDDIIFDKVTTFMQIRYSIYGDINDTLS